MSNGNPLDENAIVRKLVGVLRQVESSQATGYQLLAHQQNRRLARRRSVEARLAAHLDPDDPRLVAARQATQQVSELALVVRERAQRLAIRPEPRPDDWVVAGHVSQADGLAAVGVTVRVFDRDRKFDDFLGATRTNKYGDFAIVQSVCNLREKFGEKLPDLFLMVVNQLDELLVASTTPIPVTAGGIEHFYIQLPIPPDAATSKRANSIRL